jgi:hypothetical protein
LAVIVFSFTLHSAMSFMVSLLECLTCCWSITLCRCGAGEALQVRLTKDEGAPTVQ